MLGVNHFGWGWGLSPVSLTIRYTIFLLLFYFLFTRIFVYWIFNCS